MSQERLSRLTKSSIVVVYRRVSTKKQSKNELKHQLRKLKGWYPNLKVSDKHVHDLKEVMSGFASVEKRIAGELGHGLRILKKNPSAILIVSDADRIARTDEIFELIKTQGLGNRVFDGATGESVNDIIKSGRHQAIAKSSTARKLACATGRKAFLDAGGTLGRPNIRNEAKKGTMRIKEKSSIILSSVMRCLSSLVVKRRGKLPRQEELADALNAAGVRTGQGNFFTPERLSQLRKSNPKPWLRAIDAYARPRRMFAKVKKWLTWHQFERKRRHAAIRRTISLDELTGCITCSISSFRPNQIGLLTYLPFFLFLGRYSGSGFYRLAHP